MKDADPFQHHLKPGEMLVWTGAESERVIAAAHSPRRLMRLSFGVAAGGLAIALGYRFIEAGAEYLRQANLNAAIGAPLYLAGTITLGLVSIFSFLRINERPPAPRRYAITSERLLALNADGAITEDFPRIQVRSIEITDGAAGDTNVIITGPDENADAPNTFAIPSIEDASLKAVLATEFPEALS